MDQHQIQRITIQYGTLKHKHTGRGYYSHAPRERVYIKEKINTPVHYKLYSIFIHIHFWEGGGAQIQLPHCSISINCGILLSKQPAPCNFEPPQEIIRLFSSF